MSKHTEKEINDAIAVVQQALIDEQIQVKATVKWKPAFAMGVGCKYRAKPDLVEGWVHKDDIRPTPHVDPSQYFYVKQVDREAADD